MQTDQILEDKIKAQCKKCKYEWNTATKFFLASCPSCGNKVRVRNIVSKK